MTEELKVFIERNIDMIETQQWHNLIKKCPVRLTADLFILLRELDPDILKDDKSEGITDNKMYGIKGATRTVSAGAPKNNVYNVLQTTNQGMKGGYQIGYKTIVDALAVCDKLNNNVYRPEYRPYIMEQGTVDGYSWTEVDTVYGKAYVTDRVIHDYDPMTKLRHRADKQIMRKQLDYVVTFVNIVKLKQLVAEEYSIQMNDIDVDTATYTDYDNKYVASNYPVIHVDIDYRLKKRYDAVKILQLLNRCSTEIFVQTDPSRNYASYTLENVDLINKFQQDIYDKLGVV